MVKRGCTIFQVEGDADMVIIKAVVNSIGVLTISA